MDNIILRSAGIIMIILSVRAIASRFAIRSIERLSYILLEKKNGYEIREYPDHILAQTTVPYHAQNPNNEGFRIIAGYIFGGNTSKESIAMTTPVITQSSEKIAMTTPVITSNDDKMMTMSFVLPSKYTMNNLPIPNNDRVQLVEVPGYKVAVYQFTRGTPEKRVNRLTKHLREKLQRDGLPNNGESQLMRYNPPFTAPFMRRNEIVINI